MIFVVHIHEVNAFFVRHASSLNAGAVAASILQTDTRKSTLPHQLQHRPDLQPQVRDIRFRASDNSRSTVLLTKTEPAGRSLAQSSPPSRRPVSLYRLRNTLEAPTLIGLASRVLWLYTFGPLTLRRDNSQRL